MPARLRRLLAEQAGEENIGLPRDWALVEMREREMVLRHGGVRRGERVLEVGSGRHGLTTIPLGLMVGPRGSVCAVERERWGGFGGRIDAAGLRGRVSAVECDARALPFLDGWFDRAVSVHAFRSFHRRSDYVRALKEMLRVSSGPVIVAESTPVARTPAQRAHLEAYSLRFPSHRAMGHPEFGDVPYPTVEELKTLARRAGGRIRKVAVFEPHLPAHLARATMAQVEAWFLSRMKEKRSAERLRGRWLRAVESLERNGEEHPPVAVVELGA
jgi:cyclopropane fatty-acyl-phospholipid synthase-like methyltransferase